MLTNTKYNSTTQLTIVSNCITMFVIVFFAFVRFALISQIHMIDQVMFLLDISGVIVVKLSYHYDYCYCSVSIVVVVIAITVISFLVHILLRKLPGSCIPIIALLPKFQHVSQHIVCKHCTTIGTINIFQT